MLLYSQLLEFQVPGSSGASSKHRDGSVWSAEKGTLLWSPSVSLSRAMPEDAINLEPTGEHPMDGSET